MTTGLALVRAHLDSFIDGRTAEFEQQLAPTFRYKFLPPILGEGPVQARRWRDILFSVYRNWRCDVESEHEEGAVVSTRVSFFGQDPVEPENTPPYFYDSVLFQIEVQGSRLRGCDALYLPFEAHADERAAMRNSA